ncbi:MAG: hypothetical protein ACTSU8_05720 [Alphaproteobacteria bacterium]
MADTNEILSKSYASRKSIEWLDGAIDILLDSMAEPDDVVNQYLAEEGYTMKVKSMAARTNLLQVLEDAKLIKNGDTPFTNHAHTMNRSNRRIEP